MRRWSVVLCSFTLGALLTTGAAWFAPNLVHVSAAPPPAAAEAPKELASFRDIVKKALPAVVSIESRAKPTVKAKQPPKRKPAPDDPQSPDDLRKFFDNPDDPGPDD